MYSFPVGLDVNWQPTSAFLELPSTLKAWLVDTGSLTERIENVSTTFSVHLIGQGTAPLYSHEVRQLRSEAEQYQVREVVLFADQAPWVYARSVISSGLLDNELHTLGNSSLGKALFNDKRFTRGPFELASFASHCIAPIVNNADQCHTLYARRSCFQFAESDVLVAEVFLPESPAYR